VIYYVTGTLGAGKSYYAVRKIARALLSGKAVATNVKLADGWEHLVLSHARYYKIGRRRGDRREFYRDEIRRRYLYEPDPFLLASVRLHGRGEGRGLMVVDEAHNELNNRTWQDVDQRRFLRKMSLARKRGWHVHIISQHKDNTDAAARRIATCETRCVNWKQWLRVPLLRTPLLPVPFFLALTYPLNQDGNAVPGSRVLSRELYPLGWFKQLYDTFEDFDLPDEDQDGPVVWLPAEPTAQPGVARASNSGATGAGPLAGVPTK
jgi:zonular occludens toxin Zot